MESITGDRPTLRRVAEAAGVSVATASRVLSGKSASASSRAAVEAASRRLDYRPDPIARALRAKETGIFGVVVPELRNPFFAELVASLEDVVQADGVEVLIADSHGDASHELQRLRTLVDRRVDGILIVPVDDNLSRTALKEISTQVPVVQIDRFVSGLDVDHVGVDNQRGMAVVLRHLHELGCHRVVFVSAEPVNSTSRGRLEAFNRQTADHGLWVAGTMLGDFSVQFGREAAHRIAEEPLPDAIVCGSDVIAVGLMSTLSKLGVSVPTDVMVTGFDDTLLADLVSPGLTTLRQPLAVIAREALARVAARAAHPQGPSQHQVVLPKLIVRGSTGAVSV